MFWMCSAASEKDTRPACCHQVNHQVCFNCRWEQETGTVRVEKKNKPTTFSPTITLYTALIFLQIHKVCWMSFSRINNYNKPDCSHPTILITVSFKKALGLNLGICCVQSDMFDVEIPDSLKQHLGAKYTETFIALIFFLWHSDLNNNNFMHSIHEVFSVHKDFESQTKQTWKRE